MEVKARRRLLLATIAAGGILEHNSAVKMPQSFSLDRILKSLLPDYDSEVLKKDLDLLTEAGLLLKHNTGHSGYGNTWVSGVDTWRITSAGLVVLWSEPPPS